MLNFSLNRKFFFKSMEAFQFELVKFHSFCFDASSSPTIVDQFLRVDERSEVFTNGKLTFFRFFFQE